MALDNALPWFPLTPDYIDKYHDDVMKYLRDSIAHSDEELQSDKSFNTTYALLAQRASQIADEYVSMPLLDAQAMEISKLKMDIRIIAAAALFACRFKEDKTIGHMSLLCYMLAIAVPELSDALSAIELRCIKASDIRDVGFGMDDVVDCSLPDMVKKIEGSTMDSSDDVRWCQNHGTFKVDNDGIRLYAMSRVFAGIKDSSRGSSLKPLLRSEPDQISVMQERKNSKQTELDLKRFLSDCEDVKEDEEKVSLKTYEDGDVLTVRVKSVSYDKIHAESIDPSYETLALEIRIVSASNVRGIYMTDFARCMSMGSLVNVVYDESRGCFSIDSTVIEFIVENYWKEQEDGSCYEQTEGILLFQHSGDVPNTWLTKEGFLVRSNDTESYPRYTRKCLEVVDYDDKYDFIIVKVTDDEPSGQVIDERVARDEFITYLLYKNQTITSPAPKKPEVKYIASELLTSFQRIEAIKAANLISGTVQKRELLSIASLISYMLGNDADHDYYSVQMDYLDNLLAFAQKRFQNISALDKRDLTGERILVMGVMNEILAQYGKAEESAILDTTIERLDDTQMGAVAKLVQAANRFMGTPSLERLRADIHREICASLNVSDAIVAEEEDEDNFPFRPEGADIEHKMSWVFDNATGQFNETSQSAKCMKTICAFMNRYAEQGEAHLYIGTDEKRHFVNGIQADIDELIIKGELKAKGDLEDEYMRKIVMGKIQERFPDTYHNVTPKLCCEGKVLDLCVMPAKEGVVYLNGVAYYRSGSESKVMNPTIEEELKNRKYLLRSGMADKIDAARRAINTKHTVCLKGYDSSNSNTPGQDRKVEVFAFADEKRCDALWAFDPKDKKNKVFLLKRTESVEVLDEGWKYEGLHQSQELDVFGFSGSETIPIGMVLNTTKAKNQLVEMYPAAATLLESLDGGGWRFKATLKNSISLDAACGFYLGLSDDITITGSEAFQKRVSERVEKILASI